MAASYPTSVKSFSTKTDGQTIASSHVNDLQDEVVAVEGGLKNGVDHTLKPSSAGASDLGTSSLPWGTVHARVLDLDASTELTVSSGAVVVTRSYHSIDTESDAASDDLDTLTATGLTAGHVVIFKAENTARVVTFKDGTGNLLLNGDYALSATDRTLTLLYDGTNWRELARSVNTSTILNQSTTEQDLTGTTSATSIYSFSVPAATLGTAGVLRFTLTGRFLNNTGGGVNLTFTIAYGGTTIAGSTIGGGAWASDANPHDVCIQVLLNANGATNSQRAYSVAAIGTSHATTTDWTSVNTHASAQKNDLAVDSTSAQTFSVTVTMSSASAHFYRHAALLEKL